jgi:hypothetical protein
MSDEESPWWVHNRQDAVEYLTRVIGVRDAKRSGWTDETGENVTLPLSVARLVLAAAQAGVHKGDGRHGVRLTYYERDRRGGIMLWANGKKTELFDAAIREYEKNGGVPPTMSECKHLAAEWARQKFRVNLTLGTIKQAMDTFERELAHLASSAPED